MHWPRMPTAIIVCKASWSSVSAIARGANKGNLQTYTFMPSCSEE